MSTPPFTVVHANKAFYNFSGESSTILFIGKPIESLIRVQGNLDKDDYNNNNNNNKNDLLPLEGSHFALFCHDKKTSCTLDVLPIKDKFRNPRGGISHLLVKVSRVSDSSTASMGHGVVSSPFLSSKDGVHHHHARVFGTVG